MDLIFILTTIGILIFSAILHEVAHGFVAERLGDPTARLAGRLTLNPKSHIDPLMSLALPFILMLSGSPIILGAAKPVPVDPFNLRDGRKDLAIVALSGPLTNVILAILASLLIKTLPYLGFIPFETSSFIYFLLLQIVHLNLLLGIFNLVPIPPLDGSKIASLLLPKTLANAYLSLGSVGFFIILFLLLSPGDLSLGKLIYNLLTFSKQLLGLYS
ncbi:site-2 protease family protein [Candidatus Roizmanbacteria bacterium]|nr:site-2 protease family protein [Candidatus Roizmanbacteria bacterium]